VSGYDVVIVGTGADGGTLARLLAPATSSPGTPT